MNKLSVLLLAVAIATPVHARPCVRAKQAAVAQQIVAVPFAVPVAVPVAQIVPYWYSTQAYGMQQYAAPQPQPQVKAADAPPTDAAGVVRARCVKCHSSPEPKGSLALDGELGALPAELRRKMILRVLIADPAQRMPKGGQPLSNHEFQLLFESLVK